MKILKVLVNTQHSHKALYRNLFKNFGNNHNLHVFSVNFFDFQLREKERKKLIISEMCRYLSHIKLHEKLEETSAKWKKKWATGRN